jgi:hypothetical protein
MASKRDWKIYFYKTTIRQSAPARDSQTGGTSFMQKQRTGKKKADTYSTALAGTVVVAGAAVGARAGAGGGSAVATHFVI